MSSIVSLSRPAIPEPAASADGVNRSYLDRQLAPQPTDLGMFGDAVSSVERARTTNSTSLSNGYYTLGMIVIPKALTGITKVRFFISGAGTAGAGTAVGVAIYSGSNPASLTRVATAPVTQASFTSTGVKELTLSATLALVPGERLAWMSYIPASGFSVEPGLGCTQVTYAALINAGANYSAYKAAAIAPPATLDTTTGWTTDSNIPWWSLL